MSVTAFYPPEAKLAGTFAELVEELPIMSVLDFDVPDAVADRELGIPFAAGMNDITVGTAAFELRAKPLVMNAAVTPMDFEPGAVIIDLVTEGRLTEVELGDDAFWPPSLDTRLVIRAATKQGSDYVAGAPLIAEPGFDGKMFGMLLGGMSITGRTLRFAPLTGTAFIVTWAKGSSATSLGPEPTSKMSVKRAAIEAVPRDASVTLVAGDTEVPVWNQPGPLLPGRQQSVSFVPAAERLLRAQLATGGPPALAVTLRFRSASIAKMEITSPALVATYHADGLAGPTQQLRGSFARIELDAPARRTPSSSELRVTAKYLGRTLNDAHHAADERAPVSGLRIDGERSAAARVPLRPASLASVRVQIAVLQPSEIALELRADAAGGPSAPLAPQVVRQLKAPFVGWLEIELASPVAVATELVWITLRATKGEVVWCCDAAGEDAAARVSDARLSSWTAAGQALRPRVQLFDAVPPPPELDVELRGPRAWRLTRTGPESVDYAVAGAALPVELHPLLVEGNDDGGGRAITRFDLFSRAAIDLTLAGIRLSYTV